MLLLAGEEVQGDGEHCADLSWVWTGTKCLFYEANHRGHQQATLLKETGGMKVRHRHRIPGPYSDTPATLQNV